MAKYGDRSQLSIDEEHILDMQVLPTARRWVTDYPIDSVLFDTGLQTLQFWGELSDPDVRKKMRERNAIYDARRGKT